MPFARIRNTLQNPLNLAAEKYASITNPVVCVIADPRPLPANVAQASAVRRHCQNNRWSHRPPALAIPNYGCLPLIRDPQRRDSPRVNTRRSKTLRAARNCKRQKSSAS
jgi:hypothetical protein